MTLHKAIEAAREYVEIIYKQADWHTLHALENIKDTCRRFKAALPDKPMTDNELFNIVDKEWCDKDMDADMVSTDDMFRFVIRALKAANVLYVEEKS